MKKNRYKKNVRNNNSKTKTRVKNRTGKNKKKPVIYKIIKSNVKTSPKKYKTKTSVKNRTGKNKKKLVKYKIIKSNVETNPKKYEEQSKNLSNKLSIKHYKFTGKKIDKYFNDVIKLLKKQKLRGNEKILFSIGLNSFYKKNDKRYKKGFVIEEKNRYSFLLKLDKRSIVKTLVQEIDLLIKDITKAIDAYYSKSFSLYKLNLILSIIKIKK